MSRLRISFLPATLIAVVIFAVPIGYDQYQKRHIRNFRVVKDGVLYRSGQLSPSGLRRVIHDYGIRTVVSFRYAKSEDQDPPDLWEESVCKELGVNYEGVSAARLGRGRERRCAG